MRIAFIGASKLVVMTARRLLQHKHEVIIIEHDKQKIETLSGELDCGFLHGDGSRPAIQREADPEHTDFLFCMTNSDQDNIIAGLVGKSLGFARVVTKIDDPELEHICSELGLEDTIIPTRTISRFLHDMVEGRDILELSTMIKGDARFFSFIVREDDEGEADKVALPEKARLICLYREGDFMLADEKTKLRKGDEAVILTDSQTLLALKERWSAKG